MSITRSLIDNSTRWICAWNRGRRLKGWPGKDRLCLNLGCGLAVAKGWINIDGSLNALAAPWPEFVHKILYRFSGANRYYTEAEYCRLLGGHDFLHHDLAYGIRFYDNTVDFVYSSHFLEHLFRKDALALLKESYRVLKPGGTVRVCIPDLQYAISLYTSGKKEKMLQDYFFVEDLESSLARHKYMYDLELLEAALRDAGFTGIEKLKYREGKTPDLETLDNRPEDTLFVEAVKARH